MMFFFHVFALVVSGLILRSLFEARGYKINNVFLIIGWFVPTTVTLKILSAALDVKDSDVFELAGNGVLFVVGLLIAIALPVRNRPD